MKSSSKTTATAAAGGKGLLVLIVSLVVFVVAMAVVYGMVAVQDRHDKQYIGLLGEQRVLSQQLTKYVGQATAATDPALFDRLRASYEQFEQSLTVLSSGDDATGLPAAPVEVLDELQAVIQRWKKFESAIDTMLARSGSITTSRGLVRSITENSAQLLALSDEVATLTAQGGASPEQVYIATRQLMLIQRIVNNVNHVLDGGDGAVTAADRFGRDAALFARVVDGLLKGNRGMGIQRVQQGEARAKLEEVNALFSEVSSQISGILESSPEMFQVTESVYQVLSSSDGLLAALTALEESYQNFIVHRRINSTIGVMFGALALILLLVLGYQLRQDGLRRLALAEAERKEVEERNRRNQQAIMRLLDEMGDLADGDLTVNATVSEDITGAIADSINYAIEALRTLVTKINDTASQVSSAAQGTEATASQLAEATEHQAREITSATASMNDMANSIEDVSDHAVRLAADARKSVEAAAQGSAAVQKTIHGMDTIREQIQETSKRIKRLGESSQEIGDIVELINDIAEQTNILALNAAIQAAMAGDAGRGFAVVADEVQRLAERSANATKRIEGLVKTIQTDTNEAVISMEQSTAGVVAGAGLAEDAGRSLSTIDSVANQLASLIESVSDATRQQATAAGTISDTMIVIQEITGQTSEGTSQTASAIGKLADLASELKTSVAGFKLPN